MYANASCTTANYNVAVGYAAGYLNTATANVFIGANAGYSNVSGIGNVFIGSGISGISNAAGFLSTGGRNTFVGGSAGHLVTTGAKNTIIGNYDGNQGGLDITTANNNIVLSDGDGNPRLAYISANNAWSTGTFPISSTVSHFDFTGTYGTYGCTYTTGQYPIHNIYSGGATEKFLQFRWNNSTVGEITTNGSTTSYVTSSDYRLKENIQRMTGALEKVAQLNPVTYNWKADGSEGQGFIAHELQAVVPDCVSGEKDAVDADGKPVHQGIDTSFLVATLTAAIQELKSELDSVKTELATLKGN